MKPILFNTEMVQAILQGRKTVTRRLVKPQPEKCGGAPICCGPEEICRESNSGNWYCAHCGNNFVGMKAPYLPGDILWVRETWCGPPGEGWPYWYKADLPMHWDASETEIGLPVDLLPDDYKWRPSIHMPREAARIFLRVTGVRVERLQEITAEQCKKEGMTDIQKSVLDEAEYWYWYKNLWDSTVKPADLATYGYDANPWVWVIGFERCERGVTHD